LAARLNPGGGKGQDKTWADALRRAVLRPSSINAKLRRIEVMAEQCAKMAEAGDMQAMREIGDRLDGKPAQAIVGGQPTDNPIRHIIEQHILDHRPKD
jgi:hypothetical protein